MRRRPGGRRGICPQAVRMRRSHTCGTRHLQRVVRPPRAEQVAGASDWRPRARRHAVGRCVGVVSGRPALRRARRCGATALARRASCRESQPDLERARVFAWSARHPPDLDQPVDQSNSAGVGQADRLTQGVQPILRRRSRAGRSAPRVPRQNNCAAFAHAAPT